MNVVSTSSATDVSEKRVFYLMVTHASWWVWLVTASLLAVGLAGFSPSYLAAIVLTFVQLLVFWVRERRFSAFSVQLRIAYAVLLCVCLLPLMRWLYWLPAVGTFALLIFGNCLLARCLSLLPWNRNEPIAIELLNRTFLSRPVLPGHESKGSSGCAGGLCSIAAQVRPRESKVVIDQV
jgi:hypothetical protein